MNNQKEKKHKGSEREHSRRDFLKVVFKTRFYKLQGWNPETGWPKRDTLVSLDLGHVADELENNGK